MLHRHPAEFLAPGQRPRRTVAELIDDVDQVLLPGGEFRLLPTAELRKRVPWQQLRMWAFHRGRYTVPTLELVALVRTIIGQRSAIEIGAGYGDLGRCLGIRMTDSAMQTRPEIRRYYNSLGQHPIDPPADVERIDGNGAVERHKPEVVVASWMTQRYVDGDEQASVYGVDEDAIVDRVRCYIHVGNSAVHSQKRILRRPHRVIRSEAIVSRTGSGAPNLIHVWER